MISTYNAKNDTHYEALPEAYYQLSTDAVTIPAGKTTSEEVRIKFLKLDELEIDATYLCPLSIGGAEGVGIMNGSRTMYYLVRRSSEPEERVCCRSGIRQGKPYRRCSE